MDSLGAVLGPLAALFFIGRIGAGDRAAQLLAYRQIFLWSFLPAIAGVALLFLVREKPFTARYAKPRFGWRSFSRDFKVFVLINLVFALGNSSDVFLIVRARELFATAGNAVATVILAYVLYNLTYALGSYPAGWLADRIGPRRVFALGLLIFAAVYAGFAFNRAPHAVWLLFAVYGCYTALTDGVGKAYASKLVSPELRATGMGVYHMSTGIATFAASAAAGLLWQAFGFRAAFVYGAAMALAALLLFVVLTRRD
jgi:MFS family permease